MEEINHPARYKSGKFECIDIMIDVFGTDAVKISAYLMLLNTYGVQKRKTTLRILKKPCGT